MQKYDDLWLSGIMGKPVFRVTTESGDIEFPSPCFCYSKVSADDISGVETLSNNGFFTVDTNITFRVGASDLKLRFSSDILVREASPQDESVVREIAKSVFIHTRFHADPRIDNDVAHKIKEEWAGNFFKGKRGDLMLVAEIEGKIVGFNQVILKGDLAVIDLIGVARSAQGRGVGQAMIAALQERCSSVLVGTQISNKKSIALYEKMGFRFHDAHYVFHYHGS